MLELLSIMLIAWIAFGVIGFAIRLSWGLFKVILALLFLPGILIAMIFAGLFTIALPILIIVAIVIALGKLIF